MKEKIRSFFFILGVLFPIVCQAMVAPGPNSLVFKSSSVLNSLPSKDVQSVYQDRDVIFGYLPATDFFSMMAIPLLPINPICIARIY